MGTDAGQAIQAVSAEYDADIYVYAGPFSVGDERRFNRCTIESRCRTNAILVLTTLGGSADTAYQVVKSIRRRYKDGKFILFIPSLCKSAGTLVAVGADEIVMCDTAELGPLDIQLGKPDELGEYVSGLTPTQALDTLRSQAFRAFEDYFLKFRFRSGGQITTRMAAEVATKLAVGLFAPIYEQLDPMRLGENARSNLIAVAYGQRICTDNVKHETIERLVSEYPSHSFAIDRDEAQKLFNNVREPSAQEAIIAEFLRDDCYNCAIQIDADAIIQCLSKPPESAGTTSDAKPMHSDSAGEVSQSPVEGDRHSDGEGLKVQERGAASHSDLEENEDVAPAQST